MEAIFQCQIAKKIHKAPSVRVIVICSGHRLLWRNSDKVFDHSLTSTEFITHQINITFSLIPGLDQIISNRWLSLLYFAENWIELSLTHLFTFINKNKVSDIQSNELSASSTLLSFTYFGVRRIRSEVKPSFTSLLDKIEKKLFSNKNES